MRIPNSPLKHPYCVFRHLKHSRIFKWCPNCEGDEREDHCILEFLRCAEVWRVPGSGRVLVGVVEAVGNRYAESLSGIVIGHL